VRPCERLHIHRPLQKDRQTNREKAVVTSKPEHRLNLNRTRSMGWLKPKPSSTPEAAHRSNPNNHIDQITAPATSDSSSIKDDLNISAQHLERIDSHIESDSTATDEKEQEELNQPPLYPFQPAQLKDGDLPFIESTVVLKAQQDFHRTWLVVDTVVFDTTDFLHEHPGGNTVIESFAGQDCSWQFWRFHNRKHMRDSGAALRIGRTSGVGNQFAERPRFVGLRGLNDDWS